MSQAIASPSKNAYVEKRRVTVVGALINVVLAAAKIVFGLLGQSQALVADGLHSLSDLASDAMVLLAARFGSQDADAEHPYGHARFETVATIGLGLLLLSVAVGISYDAIQRILNPSELLVPGIVALLVTTTSILSKEWLYRYTVHVANRVRSDLLRANAWHHRSDAVSSIIVFVGIAGTMAGIPWLDAAGAIGVSLDLADHRLAVVVGHPVSGLDLLIGVEQGLEAGPTGGVTQVAVGGLLVTVDGRHGVPFVPAGAGVGVVKRAATTSVAVMSRPVTSSTQAQADAVIERCSRAAHSMAR